jgi:hypothetical protein
MMNALIKIARKFLIMPNGTPKLVEDEQTYNDMVESGRMKITNPHTRKRMGDDPFFWANINPKGQIQYPEINTVLGESEGNKYMGGIDAHKKWIGNNDLKVIFSPQVSKNLTTNDHSAIVVNDLAPNVVHHELGHAGQPKEWPITATLRSKANTVGVMTSALATIAEKALGIKNPVITGLRYGGALLPAIGAGKTYLRERDASNRATDFMKSYYPPDVVEKQRDKLDMALNSYTQHTVKKGLGTTLLSLLANLAADRVAK